MSKTDKAEKLIPADIAEKLNVVASLEIDPITFKRGAKKMWYLVFEKFLSEQMVRESGQTVILNKNFWTQFRTRGNVLGRKIDAYQKFVNRNRELIIEGMTEAGHNEATIVTAVHQYDSMLNQLLTEAEGLQKNEEKNGKEESKEKSISST